ncbi:putative 6-phosphogluconolactonase 4, chloroplastic [Senna tora]|uniref:Probable 6-phosphogluconolactonase n=1 Tax=Senna tora TaxID=362788 RepID=A0A834WAY7_9FABA|nr:putative 6-phosphogluconolactonase 4, chloroplastic [Senna tora]
MALSTTLSAQSRLLCAERKPNPTTAISPTTSLLLPQVVTLCKNNKGGFCGKGIGVRRKARNNVVKASLKWEKGFANVEVFTKEHLAVSLAYDVAQLSNKYTRDKGSFTVVLSGGSLIKYLRKLVEAPYLETIDWSKWHVFWVEERVVAKDDLDSNYKVARDGFLSKVAIPGVQIYGIADALPADGAADVWETTLRRLVKNKVIDSSESGFPKFDLMLLGMGPDGEVASLFPGHPLLNEDKKWVSHLNDAPKPPPERITYTLPVINSASNIAMVVTGAGKANAVASALEDDKTHKLPVQLVSPRKGQLKWYLDKGAASKLFKE